MILARTGQNSLVFGTVQTVGAIGAVVGGVIMSAWGRFKRRVHGVLIGWTMSGLGMAAMGVGQGLIVWSVALFFTEAITPLVNTSNQSIWQAKVAPDLQGRVFSSRRLIAWFTNPISPIIGGLLADYVLGPAMMTGSTPLTQAFGWLVGTGPGAGMALEIVFCGLGATSVGLAGYLFRPIREAEIILPDHDQLPLAQPELVTD